MPEFAAAGAGSSAFAPHSLLQALHSDETTIFP
jgi:hypothetical protein